MSGIHDLAEVGLFDERISVRMEPVRHGIDDLDASERECIARAVLRRQQEYATSRVVARELLKDLGLEGASIPTGADRAPQWPPGVTGSIAHADGMCVVAVTRDKTISAVGIDIEPATALEKDIWREICSPAELAWISSSPSEQRGILARLVFCAKEAFYKAQYEVSRNWLNFRDVAITDVSELALDNDIQGSFSVRLLVKSGPLRPDFSLAGRFAVVEGWLLAAVTCTQSDFSFAREDDGPSTKAPP